MYKKNKFEILLPKFSEKYAKRLLLPTILRLNNKLEEKGIEDNEIVRMLSELLTYLTAIFEGDTSQKKAYKKSVNSFTAYVQKTYGFVAKGSYIGMYVGIGIAIGVAIGVGIGSAIGSPGAGIAIGVGIGAAIGSAIGTSKENKLKKEGKLY